MIRVVMSQGIKGGGWPSKNNGAGSNWEPLLGLLLMGLVFTCEHWIPYLIEAVRVWIH